MIISPAYCWLLVGYFLAITDDFSVTMKGASGDSTSDRVDKEDYII